MKDVLKRMLGKAPETVQAETQEPAAPEAATVDAQVVADAAVVDTVAMQAALDTANAELATVVEALATAEARIAELTADVAAAVEFNAAREKAAQEAQLAARKEKIVAAVGTEKADALMAATAAMDAAAFDAVMAAMATTQTAEANTALFKEVGVEAEVDKSKLGADKNPVMDYLTAKYKQTN